MHLRPPTARVGSSYKCGSETTFKSGKFHISTRKDFGLSPEQSGHLYEIEPNYLLTNEYPNLCIIPMIHNVDLHKTENVPLVVINPLTDSIYLSKGEIMGFMQSQSLDISEIMTETSTEPSPILLEEDNDTEGSKEQMKETAFEYNEKKLSLLPQI